MPAVERQLVHLEVAGVQHQCRPGCGCATASASGIEWLTAKNSQSNGPSCSTLALARPRACSGLIRCSLQLGLDSARVSREPTSGMSGCSRSRYGTAPMWSSCPWVSTSASMSSSRSRM